MIPLAIASALSTLPPSEAVLMTYHLACNTGELRLDPSEGKVSNGESSSTPGSLLFEWGRPETMTYINLAYARTTIVVIATYKPKYPQQMARVCQVYSNAISHEDAERGFMSAVHDPNVTWDYRTPSIHKRFEIDRPKEGFKKRLIFGDAGWVIMETALYKEPH